jgi:TonB-dependent receptor
LFRIRNFCNKDSVKKRLISWVSIVLSLSGTFIDAAEIRGRVYDAVNALYLEGARVTVAETGDEVVSQRGGNFIFGGLSAGEFTVRVSAVGYPPLERRVVLETDTVMDLELRLGDSDVFELEAFTVTGSLVGAAKALNQQRTSSTLQNVVSSDAFGQFVDRNAAEALQRLPGVAVEDSQGEGKFLIIRGSNPTWSTVTIDGVELATPEENGRSIGLNIITVDQLESIEVNKTWMPSQKGGVVGGNVNLKTRSALDRGERFASVEAAYGQYDISDDDSWRASLTFGDVFNIGKRAIAFQVSVNQSEDNRGSDTLSLGWSVLTDYPLLQAPSGFIVDSTNMDDYRIRRERLGLSTKLELLLSPGHIISASVSYNKFDDDEILQSATLSASLAPVSFRGLRRLTTPLAIELGYDPAAPEVASRINATTDTRAALFLSEAQQLGEVVFNEETRTYEYSSNWDTSIGRVFEFDTTKDEIETHQLAGSHSFTPYLRAEWKVYETEADKENEVFGTRFGGRALNTIPTIGERVEEVRLMLPEDQVEFFLDPASFYISRTTGTYFNYKDFSTDLRQGGDLDLSYTMDVGPVRVTTQIGGSHDAREKTYTRDWTRLTGEKTLDPALYPNNELRLSNVDLYGGQGEDFLYDYGPAYQFGPVFDDDRMLAFFADPAAYGLDWGVPKNDDITFQVSNATLRDYVAEENITGGYLMQTYEWKGWDLIAGVRWEETENTFTNNQIVTRTETGAFIRPSQWRFLPLEVYSQPITTTKTYDHLLPALHLKKTFGEDWVLRISGTKTITRPLFTDLVPREIPSISSSGGLYSTTIQLPNFELRPMESTNYDISLQKYFEDVGYFNVSVFHKELDGAIYAERRQVDPGEETRPYALKYNSLGNNNDIWTFNSMVNSGAGELSGVELAFERNFDFLGEWARDFGMNFNVAFMESEVGLTTQERLGELVSLFKQPDKTLNYSIFYETRKVFVRLSYNIRGKYLQSVRGGLLVEELTNPIYMGLTADALDTWVDEYARLDLNLRWKVTPNLHIFAELTNLTNEPIKQYQGDPSRPTLVRYTGPIFFIGAKWNL